MWSERSRVGKGYIYQECGRDEVLVMSVLIVVGILLGFAVVAGAAVVLVKAYKSPYPKPDEPPTIGLERYRLHETYQEPGIPTDNPGSLPPAIPYRPITPPYVDEQRLRRTHDAHRYHRPPPPGMWDRRG